jgi:hypothetical protein
MAVPFREFGGPSRQAMDQQHVLLMQQRRDPADGHRPEVGQAWQGERHGALSVKQPRLLRPGSWNAEDDRCINPASEIELDSTGFE